MSPVPWLRAKVRQLFDLKDSHHAKAVGVAVGMFFGFTPLIGLKTLLAIGVARLLRGNLLAAAIAVTMHDVILPLMPLVLRWEYDIGFWILSNPHRFPPRMQLHGHHQGEWLHWSVFFDTGRPLLLGSVLVAAPIAILSYYATLAILNRWGHDHTKTPPGVTG
jgi:uncharacterized protein (DUF2062 family)